MHAARSRSRAPGTGAGNRPVLIARLLDSPETGNAVSGPLLDELLAVLDSVHDDPGIRLLILSGAGDDFCLGGDRGEFPSLLGAHPGGAGLHSLGNKARPSWVSGCPPPGEVCCLGC